jgi:hypothetical protein
MPPALPEIVRQSNQGLMLRPRCVVGSCGGPERKPAWRYHGFLQVTTHTAPNDYSVAAVPTGSLPWSQVGRPRGWFAGAFAFAGSISPVTVAAAAVKYVRGSCAARRALCRAEGSCISARSCFVPVLVSGSLRSGKDSAGRSALSGREPLISIGILGLAHGPGGDCAGRLGVGGPVPSGRPSEAPPQTIEDRGSAGVRARGGSSWQP